MIEIRTIPGDSNDALALVRAMFDDVVAAYGTALGPGPSATPTNFSPPDGRFVALYEDGRAVAGGGVKRLDDDTGEIKRMYVVPEARGRGLSRRLLAALEDAARELGYRRVRLDTGSHDAQAAARRLYPSAGYSEIADYNSNPYASYWAEKWL
ncbi:MAG: GNAT family N-acetyltransferase [Acidimicrobiales bacterium]